MCMCKEFVCIHVAHAQCGCSHDVVLHSVYTDALLYHVFIVSVCAYVSMKCIYSPRFVWALSCVW